MRTRHLFLAFLLIIGGQAIGQRYSPPPTYEEGEPETSGFQKDHLFIGSSLDLGFGTGYFNIGGTPEIGYTFNRWLDAGVAINLNYLSTKSYDYYGYEQGRQTSFNYGAGVFARVYPIRNVFIQLQPEYNWSNNKLYAPGGSTPYGTLNVSAPSVLAGVGYGIRVVGHMNFYTAILFDINHDINSPYRGYDGSFIPVIRAGFNFYLHSNR